MRVRKWDNMQIANWRCKMKEEYLLKYLKVFLIEDEKATPESEGALIQ